MRKVILFFMLMATLAVNAQTTNAVQEVRDYLHDCGIFYIATVDGDQPRVRPFGVAEVYKGKLYIQTGKKKNVFKQMMANPKFEITSVKPSGTEWIRISGKLVNDDSREAKAFVLDKNPDLKGMYSADDDNTAVLYITDGVAEFCSFSAPTKEVKF
ncbi:MAG: pyridoxamine 5'-phosphate oxidase family protein [Prevotella sp.]